MTDTERDHCPACEATVPADAITEDAGYQYAVCPACSTNLKRAESDPSEPWEIDEGGRPHYF